MERQRKKIVIPEERWHKIRFIQRQIAAGIKPDFVIAMEREEGKLREAFNKIDVDGGGTLDKEELQAALEEMGKSEEDIQRLLDNMVEDELDFDGFVELVNSQAGIHDIGQEETPEEERKRLFAMSERAMFNEIFSKSKQQRKAYYVAELADWRRRREALEYQLLKERMAQLREVAQQGAHATRQIKQTIQEQFAYATDRVSTAVRRRSTVAAEISQTFPTATFSTFVTQANGQDAPEPSGDPSFLPSIGKHGQASGSLPQRPGRASLRAMRTRFEPGGSEEALDCRVSVDVEHRVDEGTYLTGPLLRATQSTAHPSSYE
jgi:hypothetical protein